MAMPRIEASPALFNDVREAQKGLPVREAPELANAVHWIPAKDTPIHRWFRYREGFSPELFPNLPASRRRLDPFCGCGTTLLESARSGIPSYGVDLNPLATFVAEVKTRRYSKCDAAEFSRLSKVVSRTYRRTEPPPPPEYPLIDKLFLPESLETLLQIRGVIDQAEPGKIRNLLTLAWLAILEEASNVFKEGNGIKYRNKRRQPGKYRTMPAKEWVPRHFGPNIPNFILGLWNAKCKQISTDLPLCSFPANALPEVTEGSCLEEGRTFGPRADLCVFSPPYANRFDYFEAFKVELWMGGFVRTTDQLLGLRHRSMRNNLGAERGFEPPAWGDLEPFLSAMDPNASSVRMGIQRMLRSYFYDMRVLLRNLRGSLATRGKVVIVVGNSSYAKSIVPTDALIARVAMEEGYKVRSVAVARHLHVSSQQRSKLADLTDYMRESVIVLDSNACAS